MIKPSPLQPGDKIGILATGKKLLPKDIQNAVETLESWSLQVVQSSHLFTNEHPYLAATDESRQSGLQAMIDNAEIKAIICARGGYGTSRILDSVNYTALIERPKWIVGFSDVTALHLRLYKLGIQSIHSTMPIFFSHTGIAASVESLKNALFNGPATLQATPVLSNRYGQSLGRVVGGNLSMIVDSLATAGEPDLAGCILIVEEVDEYLYKIDRMFMHLKRAGKLSKLAGLVVGHMTNLKDTVPGFGESVEEIVLHKVKDNSFPVAFNFPSGHDNPNMAWMQGETMTLTVNSTGSRLEPSTFRD